MKIDYKINSVNNPKSIHGMFPYRGKMSSIDVANILKNLNIKKKVLLDPFCGSGTILVEAAKLNNKVYGFDLNPVAFYLSKAKIHIKSLKLEISNFNKIKTKVLNLKKTPKIPKSIIENFHIQTAIEITKYSNFFDLMSDYNKGCFMGAVALSARACNHYVWTSNIVGKKIKPFRLVNFEEKFYEKIIKNHNKSYKNIKLYKYNSENLSKKLKKNSVDIVVTSPPYFNSLDYTSYHNKFILDLLKVDRLSLRKTLIQNLKTYKDSIKRIFDQINIVTKKKSKIVFIVGDKKEKEGSLTKGSNFFTTIAPFKKYKIIERSYTNSSSQIIDRINKTSRKEQIIIFEK